MASRLKELYDTKIRAELKKQLGYKNDIILLIYLPFYNLFNL